MAAIELLKSHGSTFYPTVIFTCDDESFDVKYCFELDINLSENSKYGDNPFNRYVSTVSVMSVGFYDNVTIDELVYSHVSNYDAFGFNIIDDGFIQEYIENPDVLSSLEYEWSGVGMSIRYKGGDKNILVIGGVDDESTAEALFSSLRVIDYNGTGW